MFVNRLNDNLRARFGHKMYKIALDGGMTCPNRDGTIGTGGCIFCLDGSGAFAQKLCCQDSTCLDSGVVSVRSQIELAKERIRAKAGDCGYIAYFQSYTNTYAPVEYLEKLFGEAMECDGVEALSIATRPDCLPPEVMELLTRLNSIKPVWVELGLQTSNERTARLIRRGYELPVFDDAVKRLCAAGIETVVHIIFGLPGETRDDMLNTVRHVARMYALTRSAGVGEGEVYVPQEAVTQMPSLRISDVTSSAPQASAQMSAQKSSVLQISDVSSAETRTSAPQMPSPSISAPQTSARQTSPPPMGVKLQLLHILRGTELYNMYEAGQVAEMERDEYIDIICRALTLLPRDIIIHRLTGDGDKKHLAAPMWSADKKAVRAAMERALRERDTEQGSACELC